MGIQIHSNRAPAIVKRCLILILICSGFAEGDTPMPYNESADASAEVEAGYVQALSEDKLMLISFGANWCPDCRAFDKAIHEPRLADTIEQRYVLVKVDVGNWDKNPELVNRFENPIAGGIPSIVVTDANQNLLYSTKAGELARARSMEQAQFALFFEEIAKLKSRVSQKPEEH